MKRRNRKLRAGQQTESLEVRSLLTTITVTSLEDNMTVDGEVTLREAFRAANEDISVDGSAAGAGADTIEFADNVRGVIRLTEGVLLSEDDLTVQGPGLRQLSIKQMDDSFSTIWGSSEGDGADLTIDRLTLKGGGTTVGYSDEGEFRLLRSRVLEAKFSGVVVVGETDGNTTTVISRTLVSGSRNGGVAIAGGKRARIIESTIVNNRSKSFLGGVVRVSATGEFEIIRSTISNNQADTDRGSVVTLSGDDVTLRETTISANNGGGNTVDYSRLDGELTVDGSTIVNNTPFGTGFLLAQGNTMVRNSIIAGNVDGSGVPRDVRIESAAHFAHTFVGANTDTSLEAAPPTNPDANGNMVGTETEPIDPMLGELASNGGGTLTHAPLSGSPVIDAGAPTTNSTMDQRRRGRLLDGFVDMGSVEAASDVTFRINRARRTLDESSGQVTVEFELQLASAISQPLVVNYQPIDGSASSTDNDFASGTQSVTFDEKGDKRTVSVVVNGDSKAERDENFWIQFATESGSPSAAFPGTPEIVLRNDDRGFGFSDGEGLFLGTSADDSVSVNVNGDQIEASANGQSHFAALNSIDRFSFYGVGGDDSFIVDSAIVAPVFADGGSGEDTIVGGSGDDSLIGERDADSVSGGAGNDTIRGENGRDVLSGGDGDDYISGFRSDDTIFGGDGNDTIGGGSGQDSIDAGAGDDVVDSSFRFQDGDSTKVARIGLEDIVLAGPGHDTVFGSDGEDSIDGGEGDNVIDGRSRYDSVVTGAGADTIVWAEFVDGGDGNDTVEFARSTIARLESGELIVKGATVIGGAGDDTIEGWGRFEGGAGNDTLTANSTSSLFGESGNDTLVGSRLSDSLVGGDGDDLLSSGGSNDSLLGGLGNDYLDGGDGFDWLLGQEGDDTLSGGSEDDTLLGGDGDDSMIGRAGNDELQGGNGNDTLIGGTQNDILIGNDGADSLFGGADSDIVIGGTVDLTWEEIRFAQAEWETTRSYEIRTKNLLDGSGTGDRKNATIYLQPKSHEQPNVLGDTDHDTLAGHTGEDWFFGTLNDTIVDREAEGELFHGI